MEMEKNKIGHETLEMLEKKCAVNVEHPVTSQASSSLVFALDGCQADGLLTLLLVIIAIGLQVAAAQAPLMLLLPHPPLLGLSADRSSQTLLLFLPRETTVGIIWSSEVQ